MTRKTYNITEQRQLKLERLAIEISQKLGKQITWSQLLGYIIDNYSHDAAKDLVHQRDK